MSLFNILTYNTRRKELLMNKLYLKGFLLFFVFTALAIVSVFAQKPSISFQHLRLAVGHSENTTRFIKEDAWGYIWIGSENGLNKFDGYNFTTFKNEFKNKYSISNSDCKEGLLDSKGNFWISTRAGINLYDPVHNRFYNYFSDKYKCFTNLDYDIEDLTEDEYGNIWMVAGSDGLFKISNLNALPENFVNPSNDNSKKLYTITPDGNNNLWVGSRDGLLRFDIKTNTYHDMRALYGRGYQIRKILYEENKNRLLLSTNDGMKIIDLKTGQMKEYKNDKFNSTSLNGNNVIQIINYNNGNYLVGIDGGGLDYFDSKKEIFYHYTSDNEGQLSANNVTSVFKDSKNNIWLGSFMNGVDYSSANTNMFSMIRNNPLSESSLHKGIVTNFLKSKNGDLWVSTDGGGLYKKNKGSDEYNSFNPVPLKYDFKKYAILDLAEDKEGIIWMATYGGGLVSLNPQNFAIEVFSKENNKLNSLTTNNIGSLEIDSIGNIWFTGFYSGVTIYNKKEKKFKHYRHDNADPNSVLSDWTHSVFLDSKGTIWLSSFKGLNRYNPASDNFIAYNFSSPLYSYKECNYITDIIEGSDGNLWLATMQAGIISFNPNKGAYAIYSTKQGLSSNSVKALIEDNNKDIWIATYNGITKFNIPTKKATPFTIQDGTPPYLYYARSKYKDEKGRIYFGNSKGYLLINPTLNNKNNSIPPIVITGMKIFGKPLDDYFANPDSNIHISFLKEIKLNYSQNEIEINYAALNFTNSQRNQYAYMLEGFDEEWKKVGSQRSSKYTNLDPGDYIFRVKGSNNDGLWNETGAVLHIHISPPFWKTWWFILIEVVALLSILYFIFKIRINRIRLKNETLEKTVLKRTEELRLSNEQLETFIYKASHDIKGPLRSIIGLTTIGQKDVKDEASLVYFEHILRSTTKLDNLLADLIELTKVKEAKLTKEKIDFRELINEALLKFEHFEGYKKVHFTILVKDTIGFYSDKKLLYSIIQNLIENPIKYRDPKKDNSYLDIEVTVKELYAELKFSDNGIGISKEIQGKIFDMFFKAHERSKDTGLGLHIVKTTVEKLKGTITVESEAGEGAVFVVRIPS